MFEHTSSGQLLVVGILLTAATGGFAIAALSPSTTLPVGLSVATGPSMGEDVPEASVYVDIEPEVGDVIVYDTGETYYQHRVVDHTADGYLTRGDAEMAPDQMSGHPFATEQNIVGVVLFTIPLNAVTRAGILVASLSMLIPVLKPAIRVVGEGDPT